MRRRNSFHPRTPKQLAEYKERLVRYSRRIEAISGQALCAYHSHGLRDMIQEVDKLLRSYRRKFLLPLPVALDTMLDALAITAAKAMPIHDRRVVSDHMQLLISMYVRSMREAGIPEENIPHRPFFHPRHAMVEPQAVRPPQDGPNGAAEEKPKRRSRPRTGRSSTTKRPQ